LFSSGSSSAPGRDRSIQHKTSNFQHPSLDTAAGLRTSNPKKRRKAISGHPQAPLRLSGSQPVGTPRLPRGYPEATPRLPRGYLQAPDKAFQINLNARSKPPARRVRAAEAGWRGELVDAPEREGVFFLHEYAFAGGDGVGVGLGVGDLIVGQLLVFLFVRFEDGEFTLGGERQQD